MIDIIVLILLYSTLHGVDPNVAQAVVYVESNFNQQAVGSSGEIGLFQVLPYDQIHKNQLKDINYNINNGILKIKKSQEKCIHKKNVTYLVCYNAGVRGAKKIKHPNKFNYIVKIKNNLSPYRRVAYAKTSNN